MRGWRLAHPFRGLATAVATFVLLAILFSFGVGPLELLLLCVASLAVLLVVAMASDERVPER